MTKTCDPIIETETRLKAAVDLVHLGRYVWDLQTSVFELDARMKAMWGLPPDAPVDYDMRRSAIHPDDLPHVDAAIAKLIDSRHSGVCDNEYRVIGITDGVERWISSSETITFENGRLVAFFGVARDVTERKRTEQANLLFIAELQHRARNLLALVSSISAETLAASKSLDDFSCTFGARLSALARVQGLLSRTDVTPVTIGELACLELQALGAEPDGRRVAVDGPVVALPNMSVQILALALHELATNARKHGALAAREGRLAVTWRTTDHNTLAIEWREHVNAAGVGGGPPTRKGFGMRLIEEALPYQLDAQTRLDFEPNGVLCSVTIRLN
jgi:PAS domain S-box-containing protein